MRVTTIILYDLYVCRIFVTRGLNECQKQMINYQINYYVEILSKNGKSLSLIIILNNITMSQCEFRQKKFFFREFCSFFGHF